MEALLETRALSIHFGGLKAVENVDLTVNKGEIMSLIGPNGAGKTTFFNLVSGFLKPTSGSVSFLGSDITGKEPHAIARMGLVRTFQKTNIFADVSVEESIKIGFNQYRKANILDILTNGKTSNSENQYMLENSKNILEFCGLYNWGNEGGTPEQENAENCGMERKEGETVWQNMRRLYMEILTGY